MREERYENENLLQQLVERYPELLNDDASTEAGRRAFLLVRREASLADTDEGASSFFVDHHFLDESGVPTLVEVKRSQDPRIRRSVVGQMLDYAARAVIEWTGESVRRDFEQTCSLRDQDHQHALAELIGEDADVDAYWALVSENLAKRRIRLVLVADEIPATTRKVIEFLNAEMVNTEVIGIEIKRYRDPSHGVSALVPRPTATTEQVKARKAAARASGIGTTWNQERFLEAIEVAHGVDVMGVAAHVLSYADEQGWSVVFSAPGTKGAARIDVGHGGLPVRFLHMYTSGSIALAFDQLRKTVPAYESDAPRLELMSRFETCAAVDLKGKFGGGPQLPLAALLDQGVRTSFLELVAEVSRGLAL